VYAAVVLLRMGANSTRNMYVELRIKNNKEHIKKYI
jgi:hypothetical protein